VNEKRRAWLKGLGLFALGVVLVVLVIRAIGTSFDELVDRARFSPGYAALALAVTALGNAAVAYRWKLLSEHRGDITLPFTNYFRVIMVTRLLGQFSSNLLMEVVGRSTGLRWQGDSRSLGRRLSTLLLERGLDVLLLCLMLGWALSVYGASPAIALLAFLGICAASVPLSGPFLRLSQHLLGVGGSFYLRLRGQRADVSLHDPRLSPALVQKIALLGVLRYVLVAAQYRAMGATVGVVLPPFFIGAATPVAQLSTVIALTPGSLGIQEAGWAGALSFLGLDEASTALFVVGQRLVLIASFALVAALAEALYRFQRGRRCPAESPTGAAVTEGSAPSASER